MIMLVIIKYLLFVAGLFILDTASVIGIISWIYMTYTAFFLVIVFCALATANGDDVPHGSKGSKGSNVPMSH
jgi:hypothetical protein